MPKRKTEEKPPPPAITRPAFAEPHEDSPVIAGESFAQTDAELAALKAKGNGGVWRCPVDGVSYSDGAARCAVCGTVKA